MIRLAVLERDARAIADLMAAAGPKEQGCFCLLREGRGVRDRRLLAAEAIVPPADAWEKQGIGSLRPAGHWVSVAVSRAVTAHSGLLFVHSHPSPEYPIGLSAQDRRAIAALGQTLAPMLDGPFAAVIVHPEGWSGVVWSDDGTLCIDRIVSTGRTLRPLGPPSKASGPPASGLDARQSEALGDVHRLLRELRVGVVGVGGTGSPVAEQLVRMGVDGVTLIDDDTLDTPSNVRRVFGSTCADLAVVPHMAKVDVVGRHLDGLGLGVSVNRRQGDVRKESVFRELLDTDVVICCTDTHGSRAMVNELASSYLLPVIDIGARVGSKANGSLAGLAAEVRVLTPATPCLWCRKAISADVIRAESLPDEQKERLEQEGYLTGGAGDGTPSVVALTVLGGALGACALLALLSEDGEVVPSGYVIDGFFGDSIEICSGEPLDGCRCRQRLGVGDSDPPPFLTGTS